MLHQQYLVLQWDSGNETKKMRRVRGRGKAKGRKRRERKKRKGERRREERGVGEKNYLVIVIKGVFMIAWFYFITYVVPWVALLVTTPNDYKWQTKKLAKWSILYSLLSLSFSFSFNIIKHWHIFCCVDSLLYILGDFQHHLVVWLLYSF